MSFEPLRVLQSSTLVLSEQNIDTDQIIPARFLTTTDRAGLGKDLFSDWRYNADGSETDHLLNTDAAKACKILVAGRNFACGSSREHAPWALYDYGIRVVISSEIADIFFTNALKNGLLPIVINQRAHDWLLDHSGEEVTVDLEAQEIRLPGNGGTHSFNVDPFARNLLMQGQDELDWLAAQTEAIEHYEAKR